MTCQEFASIARDYTHAQWLSEAQRTQARQHVSGCAECRVRVENESILSAALGRLRNEQSALEPPAEIETALLAAFAARLPQTNRFRRALWWAIPAAAAVLVGVILGLTSPQEPARAVAAKEPLEVVQAEPVVEPAPVVASQPRPKSTPRVRSAVAAPERVTDFVALRYGKPLESGEPIRVIRMQMRRSELLRLGLPVAPDAASTFIKADVLLGEDGLAKAIRFVY